MSVVAHRVEEQLRRISARATEEIVRRSGRRLSMYVGCGYPKSGTVWLCQLMASYLGAPYPQNYLLPVAMRSVIHAHWSYDRRLPPTAYISRDGRDVLVSLYFYEMRALTLDRNPQAAAARRARYERIFGRHFDPGHVDRNLPLFIRNELSAPTALRGVSWAGHMRQWLGQHHPQVTHVRYEDLLSDPVLHLTRLMAGVTGEPGDPDLARLAVERFDFRRSGRPVGEEDRTSFQRKGVSGEWRTHFTPEANAAFLDHAGEALRLAGYEEA